MEYPAFFGETLPVISRAVDEDEDEFEPRHIECDVSIKWTTEAKELMSKERNYCLECRVLIIGIGQEASGFLDAFLLHGETTELLATMSADVNNDMSDSSGQWARSKDNYCLVHCLKNKPFVLFVHCTLQVSPYQAPSWTDQLFSCLRMCDAQVMVLTTEMVSSFLSEQCQSDLPAPFLRSLHTSSFVGRTAAPYLEQPNLISGLPAQIMTYLEVHKVAAVLYVCYKDVSFIDIKTMKSFCKILQSAPLKDYAVNNPNADSQLLQLAELHRSECTLYV